jgi:hypothetical protein
VWGLRTEPGDVNYSTIDHLSIVGTTQNHTTGSFPITDLNDSPRKCGELTIISSNHADVITKLRSLQQGSMQPFTQCISIKLNHEATEKCPTGNHTTNARTTQNRYGRNGASHIDGIHNTFCLSKQPTKQGSKHGSKEPRQQIYLLIMMA